MTEWVMVPRNATPEMVSALDDFRNGPHSARAAYRAMLDAAPAAPQQAKTVGYFQRDCDYFEQVEDVYQWDADVIPLYLHPPAAEVQDGFDFREECDRRAHVIARLMSEAQRLREAAKATLAAVGDAPWILGRNLDEVTKALNELRRALEA